MPALLHLRPIVVFLFFVANFDFAQARACENFFQPAADSSTSLLEMRLNQLRQEQQDVRNRIWMPSQIREVEQKGRLEFESPERAIRYYRGLLAWKIRVLETELRDIKEAQTIEKLRDEGTRHLMIDGKKVDVLSNLNAVKRAMRAADLILQIQNPSARQIAALILVGQHLIRIEQSKITARGFREDERTALETSIARIMSEHFSEVTFDNAKFAKRLLDRNEDRPNCCASGSCPGCTHPNVVFRNQNVDPAPTHSGVTPKSTLPLYIVMDRLKVEFPNHTVGTNFWDFMFEPGTPRL